MTSPQNIVEELIKINILSKKDYIYAHMLINLLYVHVQHMHYGMIFFNSP